MKKKEILNTIKISKSKEIGILIKYPFWMKWLMKFIEFYVIPDTKDYRINYDLTFPCEYLGGEIAKELKLIPSSNIARIT